MTSDQATIYAGEVVVPFAARTPLPPGYTVQWWEHDEHYHWVLSEDVYSDCSCDRWACWRGAWNHYRAQKNIQTEGVHTDA